ncbi:MAG: hypothetical protein ACREBE_25200 [bacterium]
MTSLVPRDERETAIDNAADRLSYIVLAYGMLVIVAIRGFNGEASWDLLGLVVLAGAVGLGYRLRKRVVSRPWLMLMLGTLLGAGLLAVFIVAGLPR